MYMSAAEKDLRRGFVEIQDVFMCAIFLVWRKIKRSSLMKLLNVDMFNGPVRWNEETNTPITKRLRNYFKISPDPQEQMVFCLEMIQMQIMVIIGYFAGAFFLLILKWIYVP